MRYQEKLKEKYSSHPEVRRIARKKHVPKHVLEATKERRIQMESKRRKYVSHYSSSCFFIIQLYHFLLIIFRIYINTFFFSLSIPFLHLDSLCDGTINFPSSEHLFVLLLFRIRDEGREIGEPIQGLELFHSFRKKLNISSKKMNKKVYRQSSRIEMDSSSLFTDLFTIRFPLLFPNFNSNSIPLTFAPSTWK